MYERLQLSFIVYRIKPPVIPSESGSESPDPAGVANVSDKIWGGRREISGSQLGKCSFPIGNFIFAGRVHKFSYRELVFSYREYKYAYREHKKLNWRKTKSLLVFSSLLRLPDGFKKGKITVL